MTYTPTELFEYINGLNKPVAVTRLGDGEARILNYDYGMVLQRQLGYVPEPDRCNEIRNNLIEAYLNSDIIGLPQNKRPGLSEYWYRCEELLLKACGKQALFTETSNIDFHTDWLRDEFYDRLLTNRKNLVYVSCRNLSEQFREKYNIENIYWFEISPEAKFNGRSIHENHYPQQFDALKRIIKDKDFSDCLCLVGAGVIGKIYTTWFKERGGIALDIGSVFDYWAGLDTRGSKRAVGAVDNTYKL